MIKNWNRGQIKTIACAVAAAGMLLIVAVYGIALTARGPDVGDNNGCRSAYADAPATQPERNAYRELLDSADSDSIVDWTARWSYFPPGWVCIARGHVNGEGQELGAIHPSARGGIAVVVGITLAAGGIASLVGLRILQNGGSRG